MLAWNSSMLTEIFLLIVGFFLLIKGADWLVDGSAGLARRLGVSDIVIGLTVVSFGTSAPELVVNLFSAFSGETDLALGNIIGSNISNVLLVLGIAAIVAPLQIKTTTIWREIPLSLLAALALFFLVNDQIINGDGSSLLTRADGLTLLLFFAIFLYYTYSISQAGRGDGEEQAQEKQVSWQLVTMLGLGLFGLIAGGKFIVDNAVALAKAWQISETLVGLTLVALGTSIPELATSIVAAWKGRDDIAVGNIVGSGIFNILFILALTSLIAPIPLFPFFNIDLMVVVGSSLLLFLSVFVGRRHMLERWQGIAFVVMYFAYIGYAFWRG